MQKKTFIINGISQTVEINDEMSLGDVLREKLLLTGTKMSCKEGHCGACSVILDGKLTLSCVTRAKRVPDGAQNHNVEWQ
jgi:aldehyde oxidoreductase